MKKLFIISIVCAAVHFTGNAQSVRFGITAGAAFANYDSKVGDRTSNFNSKTGVTAGVLLDIPMGTSFSFQPGVNFVQKGFTDQLTTESGTIKEQLNVNNIEVPLNFLLNARGNGGNFFIGAGPSFTYALSGKSKIEDGTNSASQDLKFGSGTNDDMKSMDIGANFTAGYCFQNGLMFSVNYNRGFSNLLSQGSDVGSMKSQYFGVKLGFLLPGSGKK